MKLLALGLFCSLWLLQLAQGQLVSYEEFKNAAIWNGYPTPSMKKYVNFEANLNSTLIDSKQEAAMALAQFLHESDGLRAKREYACEQDGCPDHYKTSWCDVKGEHYYGRGYIQLSWCYNYQAASRDLYGVDWLVWDPDVVARDDNVAWDTAFWFWRVNVHFQPGVLEGKFGATTKAINGAMECSGTFNEVAKKRFVIYNTVRRAFGFEDDGDERGCYN